MAFVMAGLAPAVQDLKGGRKAAFFIVILLLFRLITKARNLRILKTAHLERHSMAKAIDHIKPSTEEWLSAVLPRHVRLTDSVVSLLENILRQRKIEYLSVAGRTKTPMSAKEKIKRKSYNDLTKQLTDLSGIRIITYLESQVYEVSAAVRYMFEVDESNSMDRSSVLGSDRMGYRSAHFVCTLGEKRDSLAEYDQLCELPFEIQVRTVLQHAWAELAHDRSFKFGPGLPIKIERKLNLYSGMLEIVDNAFNAISKRLTNIQPQ